MNSCEHHAWELSGRSNRLGLLPYQAGGLIVAKTFLSEGAGPRRYLWMCLHSHPYPDTLDEMCD